MLPPRRFGERTVGPRSWLSEWLSSGAALASTATTNTGATRSPASAGALHSRAAIMGDELDMEREDQARFSLDVAAALTIRVAGSYGPETRAAYLQAASLAFDSVAKRLLEGTLVPEQRPQSGRQP